MFISEAFAASTEAAATAANSPIPDSMKLMFQFALILAVLYFVIIRPQTKRMKQHQAMVNGIIPGTKVVVNGIIGTVRHVNDKGEILVRVADGVELTVLKEAVTGIFKDEVKKEG